MNDSGETDISLMEIIRNNNASETEKEDAREKLYIQYFDTQVKYAQYLGATVEDAEDIAHEALLRAFITKSEQFEPRGNESLKAWVNTIVRNLYFNFRRKHRNEGGTLDLTLTSKGINPIDSMNYNMEIYREAGLSDLETKVATLHIDYDLKPREIAYLMPEHSPENISRIIYRLKGKLRGLLDD